ncbi:MAG: NifU family protein [Phycisphaerales bacterium]|nr:NifU family protein [Phycisphaerales bacterium]
MPDKPSAATPLEQLPALTVNERVQQVLATLRPSIQWDGGDIQLVDISPQGVVSIRLLGACIGCPSSEATLKLGVERKIRDAVPEITQVIAIEG